MAVSSEISSEVFTGNGSSVTPYSVNFDVRSADHIRVEVMLDGETEYTVLDSSDFTVSGNVDDGFTVTTDTAYTSDDSVLISRWVPLTQDLVLPLAGSLPGPGIEARMDLLAMQIQQVYRVLTGLGVVSQPQPVTLRTYQLFGNAAARTAATPDFAGQLGVQLDTGVIYRALSTTEGDWTGATGGTVPLGGTGLATATPYALLAGGTTGTGALQQISGLGTSGYVLKSNGAGALPTWQALASGGDVVGPASSQGNSIPLYSGTTGKLLKAGMGTNDGGSAYVLLGTITDTSARPMTVFQTWNNAGLDGCLLHLSAEATAAATGSTFLKLTDDATGNRGKWMYSGEIRTLDGSGASPVYSFESESGTGMHRDTATGAIRFTLYGSSLFEIQNGETRSNQAFGVRVGGYEKFLVSTTFVKAFVDVLPYFDNAVDLGSAALQYKDVYFAGSIKGNGTVGNAGFTGFVGATITLSGAGSIVANLHATGAAAPTIASASTIAPTKAITFISGTTAINTITPPSPISAGGGQITLIPTGIFTTTTAGNIALASTAVVGKALIMTYDVTTTKWYPSYT